MAVVWGTVKDHKGYIEVKSIVRKGSTFTVDIKEAQKLGAGKYVKNLILPKKL